MEYLLPIKAGFRDQNLHFLFHLEAKRSEPWENTETAARMFIIKRFKKVDTGKTHAKKERLK